MLVALLVTTVGHCTRAGQVAEHAGVVVLTVSVSCRTERASRSYARARQTR